MQSVTDAPSLIQVSCLNSLMISNLSQNWSILKTVCEYYIFKGVIYLWVHEENSQQHTKQSITQRSAEINVTATNRANSLCFCVDAQTFLCSCELLMLRESSRKCVFKVYFLKRARVFVRAADVVCCMWVFMCFFGTDTCPHTASGERDRGTPDSGDSSQPHKHIWDPLQITDFSCSPSPRRFFTFSVHGHPLSSVWPPQCFQASFSTADGEDIKGQKGWCVHRCW